MSSLIDRINNLTEEVEKFPLGKCSPSDDFDMQTAYLYSFKDLAKRFVASLKLLGDTRLLNMLESIDLNPEYITEAYDLKADLQILELGKKMAGKYPDSILDELINKFCVIDLEKVIHGSYNWTNKAQYNNETISIIDSRLEAKKYADQFLKIKQEILNGRK
ncbi:MAG: phospholipase D-like domain-containing protein [Bacteroidales bacterium]|nr:phospholipase D-like domain-containing protein [Bacteroidales bacterium]